MARVGGVRSNLVEKAMAKLRAGRKSPIGVDLQVVR